MSAHTAWSPPDGSEGVFRLAAYGDPGMQALQELLAKMRLKQREFGSQEGSDFNRISLADPRWPLLLPCLQPDQPVWFECCWIEEPKPVPDTEAGWFILSTGPGEFRSPARTPATRNLGDRDGVIVASERFVRFVADHRFSGLGELPLEDSSPSDPSRWLEVFAESPIGRGLDHPLIDPAKLLAEKAEYKFDIARRWGEPVAWLRCLWDDLRIENEAAAGIIRLKPHSFRVEGHDRCIREYLPHADFGYWHWGFQPDKGPGYKGRPIRNICCSARVRKALLAAGLMRPADFTPLVVVAASDADAEILDEAIPFPLPLPVYTPEEARAELARRQSVLASRSVADFTKFMPRPISFADLRGRVERGDVTWQPSADEQEFAEIASSPLYASTPAAWRLFAPLLPLELSTPDDAGDSDDADPDEVFDWLMCPPEWNSWLSTDDDDRPDDEKPSSEDLIIGCTPYGDWYAVRKNDPLLPDDARVVHWDHETLCIAEEWPTIAAFAGFLVGLSDWAARRG